MAKAANQKLKILYLLRLLEETDETHLITMNAILEELERQGITAERKSVYDDMDALRTFGAQIVSQKGRYSGYYLKRTPGTELVAHSEPAPSSEPTSHAEPTPQLPKWAGGDLRVTLSCGREAFPLVLEALGEDRILEDTGANKKGRRKVTFYAIPENAFFGWLTGLGTDARLAAPGALVKNYRRYLKEIRGLYKEV